MSEFGEIVRNIVAILTLGYIALLGIHFLIDSERIGREKRRRPSR